MTKKKHSVSKEDAALFRDQVKDAKQISSNRVVHDAAKPVSSDRHAPALTKSPLPENLILDDNFDLSTAGTNSPLFFSQPGLQNKEIKRLKRGDINIEAKLDLHGLTTLQAKQELMHFIQSSQWTGKRCVLLIHGRGLGANTGKAILKAAINHWLPQIPAVMAFASATPNDGGLGAVYMLLRKHSK